MISNLPSCLDLGNIKVLTIRRKMFSNTDCRKTAIEMYRCPISQAKAQRINGVIAMKF